VTDIADHWRTLSIGAHTAGDEWAVRYLNEHFVLRTSDPAIVKRVEELETALAPFVAAAKMGVATYEAVKAANLRRNGLSEYETVYVGAGSHAAESRVSYSDWAKLAALSPSQQDKRL
jgi:hypothetical protein